MKVRILKAIAGFSFNYRPDEIVDLPEKEVARWLKEEAIELIETEMITPRETAVGPAQFKKKGRSQ